MNTLPMIFGALIAQLPAAEPAQAQEPLNPVSADNEPFVLAFTAAMSKGAHQAGMAYAMIATGTRIAEDPSSSALGKTALNDLLGRDRVAGIAGVSAGALNAMIGALMSCLSAEEAFLPEGNHLWDAWTALDWDRLFPGRTSCEEYAERHRALDVICTDQQPYHPEDGFLSSNASSGIRRAVLKLMSRPQAFRPGCRVPLAFSLSAAEPAYFRLGEYEIPTIRRTVFAELRTTHVRSKTLRGGGVRFCAMQPDGPAASSALSLGEIESFDPVTAQNRMAPLVTMLNTLEAQLSALAGAEELGAAAVSALVARYAADEIAGDAPQGSPVREQATDQRERAMQLAMSALSKAVTSQRIALPGATLRALARAYEAQYGALGSIAISEEAKNIWLEMGTTCRTLDPYQIIEVVRASAAMPVLTRPQPLTYCGTDCDPVPSGSFSCPEGKHLCRGYFADGGILDRTPLAAAAAISGGVAPDTGLGPAPAGPKIVVLQEARPPAESRTEAVARARGLRFYREFLTDLLSVGRNYEIQLLERGEVFSQELGREIDVETIFDPHPIMGDLLFNMGAFVDHRFRQFDFHRGVVAGLRWRARHACPEGDLKCILEATELLAERANVRASAELTYILARSYLEDECRTLTGGAEHICEAAAVYRAKLEPVSSDIAAARVLWTVTRAREYRARRALHPIGEFARLMDQLRTAAANDSELAAQPYVHNFEEWFYDQIRKSLRRLESLENPDADSTKLISAAGQAFSALAYRNVETGWRWGTPSSLPRDEVSTGVSLLIPDSIGADLKGGDRAIWSIGSNSWDTCMCRNNIRFTLAGELPLQWVRNDHQTSVLLTGLGLSFIAELPYRYGSGLGLRGHGYIRPYPDSGRAGLSPWVPQLGSEVFLRLFGHLDAGVVFPDLADQVPLVRDWSILISFSDIEGLFYWLYRLGTR